MRLLNPKAKGSRRERAVRDIYLSRAHDVVKAAGSLGMFDLVCIAKEEMGLHTIEDNLVLIQVKSNYIHPLEVQVIADHDTVARKEIWIKKDHQPWMMCIISEPIEDAASDGCPLPKMGVENVGSRAKISSVENLRG